MELQRAVTAFAALAQITRLRTLQLLANRGGEMRATDIATEIGVPANTMSTHLAIMQRAGLVQSARNGREVLYSADMPVVTELLTFAGSTIALKD